MFCPKCGKQNSQDSKFCAGCGASVGGANFFGNAVPATNPPPAQNTVPIQAHIQNNAPIAKKNNSCILAVILVAVAAIFALIGAVIGAAGFFFLDRVVMADDFDRAKTVMYNEGYTIVLLGSSDIAFLQQSMQMSNVRGIERAFYAYRSTADVMGYSELTAIQFNTESNAINALNIASGDPSLPPNIQAMRRNTVLFVGTSSALRILRDEIGISTRNSPPTLQPNTVPRGFLPA